METRQNSKKISPPFFVFLILSPFLTVIGGALFKYATHEQHKMQNINWSICRTYGPTINPRPTEEWCEKEKRVRDAIKQDEVRKFTNETSQDAANRMMTE